MEVFRCLLLGQIPCTVILLNILSICIKKADFDQPTVKLKTYLRLGNDTSRFKYCVSNSISKGNTKRILKGFENIFQVKEGQKVVVCAGLYFISEKE